MAIVKRTGCEQYERDQASRRTTQAAADAPRCNQADDADTRPDQPPGFKQVEWKHLGNERSRHVEAAAVFVKIDEGKCALVGKARAVEGEQQVAILRMGVVVPAETVVAERYHRNRCHDGEDDNGKTVGSDHCRPGAGEANG